MLISDLSDKEIDNYLANYRRKKKTEGGKFSLREILLEQMRRKPSVFGVREVAAKIIELSAASSDGLVTYREIWNAFCPNAPWTGHKSMRIVSHSLLGVMRYCVIHNLPVLNVLVVRTSNRKLTTKAIENIYTDCKQLRIDVGSDPKAFVDNQTKLSRAFVIHQLPDKD